MNLIMDAYQRTSHMSLWFRSMVPALAGDDLLCELY